jgi:hypothetical protein
MRKLITTIALLALIDTSAAIAQTVGSRNPSVPPPSTNPDKQLLGEPPPAAGRSSALGEEPDG